MSFRLTILLVWLGVAHATDVGRLTVCVIQAQSLVNLDEGELFGGDSSDPVRLPTCGLTQFGSSHLPSCTYSTRACST